MAKIAEACLDALGRYGPSSSEFRAIFKNMKHDLLLSGDDAIAIVTKAAQPGDDCAEATILLGMLLDEARMGVENDSLFGKSFLENAERVLGAEIAAGTCAQAQRMQIAGQYRRCSLPVPDILKSEPAASTTTAPPPGMPDLGPALASLAAEVEMEGGGPYEFFSNLDEMSAGMPDEARAGFIHHLISLDNPFLERCALYWLLSDAPLVSEAAAIALQERLHGANLAGETLALLPIIRSWLPDGEARTIIDDIGRQARRKGLAGIGHQAGEKPVISKIMSSIADGTGTQSIAFVGKRKKQVFVAMILLKGEYGIKDAFIAHCRSKSEADNIIAYSRQEAGSVSIDRASAELLLEAALADGIKNGHAPSSGFIDMIDACALHGLRPQERDLQALLDHVDPQKEVQNATEEKLDRMLNNDNALEAVSAQTQSWFEDNSETRKIFRKSGSTRDATAKIFTFFDGRRDIWARRFLLTAIILQSARRTSQAKLLAASAFALMQNVELHDIPLVEDMILSTLQAGLMQRD